jgi:hypothetical protein
MRLIINDIDVNVAKKICLLIGRDFKAIEEKEKKKGKQVKNDVELLAEMKADTDKKVNDKKPKKK